MLIINKTFLLNFKKRICDVYPHHKTCSNILYNFIADVELQNASINNFTQDLLRIAILLLLCSSLQLQFLIDDVSLKLFTPILNHPKAWCKQGFHVDSALGREVAAHSFNSGANFSKNEVEKCPPNPSC